MSDVMSQKSTGSLKYLLTIAIVVVAVVVVLLRYWDLITNPWTRDGQVRAEVIQIAPRISGPIVQLPIKDNQLVKAGDLLFQVDPRTFEADLAQATAQYDKAIDTYHAQEQQVEAARAQVEAAQAMVSQARSLIKEADSQIANNKAEYDRQIELLRKRATSQQSVDQAKANFNVLTEQRASAVAGLLQSQASFRQAEAALAETKATLGAEGEANAGIRDALANVVQAELNLEFTRVTAPVEGYVTNLNLRIGSQTVTNQPALALVDINSFWIDGFFRETLVGDIHPGNQAKVTLMTYPDTPIDGVVDSLGWGISQQDGSTGFDLLPTVSATFEWIRLAQRVPVKVYLTNLPEHIRLRVGTTASVLVKTGTSQPAKSGAVKH